MAEQNPNESHSQTEASLTQFEKRCVEELEKETSVSEENFHTENGRTEQKLYSSFQNSASAVSNLYKASLSSGYPTWPLFQQAANTTTLLYKDSLELLRNSFELGSRYGGYRRNKEFLSWAKKKRRLLQREDVMSFICGKAAPIDRFHRPVASYGRNGGNRSELSSPRIIRDDRNDIDLQLFKDAALQGRRSSSQSTNSPARGGIVEDFHGCCFTRDSRKRIHSSDCRTGSPSQKRAKMCFMDTDDF